MSGFRKYLERFRRDDEGAILVEFALVLPIMLLIFGLSIEAARTFWSYQATIAGVRDATRYVGRSEQTGICDNATPNLDRWQTIVTDIVREQNNGTVIFPSSITINSVTPVLTCVADGDFRLAQVPMATVTAQLSITFPFSGLFDLVGAELPTIDTVVSDTGRIFGA